MSFFDKRKYFTFLTKILADTKYLFHFIADIYFWINKWIIVDEVFYYKKNGISLQELCLQSVYHQKKKKKNSLKMLSQKLNFSHTLELELPRFSGKSFFQNTFRILAVQNTSPTLVKILKNDSDGTEPL